MPIVGSRDVIMLTGNPKRESNSNFWEVPSMWQAGGGSGLETQGAAGEMTLRFTGTL